MNKTRKLVTGVWGGALAVLVIVTLKMAASLSPLFYIPLFGVVACIVAFCVITCRWVSTDKEKINRLSVLGGMKADESRVAALRSVSCDWLNRELLASDALGSGCAAGAELFVRKPK